MKMNKKLQGFVLLEIVISIFFLSIIVYFTYFSLFTNKKIEKDVENKIKAVNIANSIVEEVIATGSYQDFKDLEFESDVKIYEVEKDFYKVEAVVRYENNKKEVKISAYY